MGVQNATRQDRPHGVQRGDSEQIEMKLGVGLHHRPEITRFGRRSHRPQRILQPHDVGRHHPPDHRTGGAHLNPPPQPQNFGRLVGFQIGHRGALVAGAHHQPLTLQP